ncbi:hypothetical protein VC83_06139 [Pseudogymnoascus destructans]|uniref:Uncharacterized protein n=1 Tax=Pseudogymnoascus destructans TaxID=655981 RepID=A0A177ACC0_9PEZI|nr:uncharacterized protein VC83_06139 [Pseudogymnoascus destructans]OAF58921.1 hypothetical protein VC83_06139 [Pseudogymnoascus destructans]
MPPYEDLCVPSAHGASKIGGEAGSSHLYRCRPLSARNAYEERKKFNSRMNSLRKSSLMSPSTTYPYETVLTQLTSSIDTNHEFDAGSRLSFHNFDGNSECE